MTPLKHYLQDGANRQARAVLFLLQNMTIEESWNPQSHVYEAEPQVARWENCREQGYVITMYHRPTHKRLCIAFFEHRNSDDICAIKWEQNGLNSPTIDTADFGGKVYKDKWDVSFQVGAEQIAKMSEWIEGELRGWWIAQEVKHKKAAK